MEDLQTIKRFRLIALRPSQMLRNAMPDSKFSPLFSFLFFYVLYIATKNANEYQWRFPIDLELLFVNRSRSKDDRPQPFREGILSLLLKELFFG